MTRIATTTVRRRFRAAALACAMLMLGLAATPAAHAGFIVTVTEAGSDVLATGAGSLDLTGMSGPVDASSSEFMWPSQASISVGLGEDLDNYAGATGPGSFGSGGLAVAPSSSGNQVVLTGFDGNIYVPRGYSFGDPLSGTSTWAGETFATLGLTPGVYTYTLPNDTFTVVIGTVAAVPAPATLMLLVSAVAGFGTFRAWRRR